MLDAGCGSALPCPTLLWQQYDSECIFVTLEVYLTILFSEIFCFGDFFRDGMVRDRQRDIWTDRLFMENIVLNIGQTKVVHYVVLCCVLCEQRDDERLL